MQYDFVMRSNIPNSHYEQIDQFTYDLQKLILRYKKEWDLPLESIVGSMDFVKNEIVSGDYSIEFDFSDDDDIGFYPNGE